MSGMIKATRGYLAGFGTAGTLLAGGAVVFVLASAIVAFNGWPQVAGSTPNSTVISAPASASPAQASRLANSLSALTTARAAAATRASRVSAAGGGGGPASRAALNGGVLAPAPATNGLLGYKPGMPSPPLGGAVPLTGCATTACKIGGVGQSVKSGVGTITNAVGAAGSTVTSTVKKLLKTEPGVLVPNTGRGPNLHP